MKFSIVLILKSQKNLRLKSKMIKETKQSSKTISEDDSFDDSFDDSYNNLISIDSEDF